MSKVDVFSVAQERERQHEATQQAQEAARRAALGALSPLRTISKVLAASLTDTTLTDPQATEKASQALIEHIGRQTVSLYEQLGSVEDKLILPSLTGSVTTAISELYRLNGEAAFKVDMASVLAKAAQVNGIWEEPKDRMDAGSLSYRRSMSVMHAMSPVLAAAQTFDFYHDAQTLPIDEIQDMLWGTVDATLKGDTLISQMDEAEQEMLRRNLLLRAGELLAGAWHAETPRAKAQMAEATTEERRAIQASGLPLDSVFEQFRNSYALLERTFNAAIHSHYQAAQEELNNQPAPLAP